MRFRGNTAKVAAGRTLVDLINRKKFPSQLAFRYSTAREVAFIGGVGCGKSEALCEKAIELSWLFPDNEGLIGRYRDSELESTTKRQFFETCPPDMIAEVLRGDNAVRIRTIDPERTSLIWFRHIAEQVPGKDHLKSMNLAWFAIDQAEECEAGRWDDLMGRLRRRSMPYHQGFAIANPDGRNWMWKKWIYPAQQRGAVETVMVPGRIGGEMTTVPSVRYQANEDCFAVVAHSAENLALPEDYVLSLMRGRSPEWVARYVQSSFDPWVGRIYSEYSEISVHNIDPFPIPPHWPAIVPIDVGGDSPWAVLVHRVEPDTGDVYVTNEFYERTVLLREVATWIKTRSGIPNWMAARYICDPENKQVIFDLAAEHQIFCEAARKGPKVPGILHVADYLHRYPGRLKIIPQQQLPDGRVGPLLVKDAPRLWVFKNCAHWRREHADWRWKRNVRTNEATDVPEDKDDHTCDCEIYGMRVRPALRELVAADPNLDQLKTVDLDSYREAVFRKKMAESTSGKHAGLSELTACGMVLEREEEIQDRSLPW
jgi:hypothetical protein